VSSTTAIIGRGDFRNSVQTRPAALAKAATAAAITERRGGQWFDFNPHQKGALKINGLDQKCEKPLSWPAQHIVATGTAGLSLKKLAHTVWTNHLGNKKKIRKT